MMERSSVPSHSTGFEVDHARCFWAANPWAARSTGSRCSECTSAVDHLADSDAPFAAAALARRDQRLDMRPFGQVARITQFVAVVARAVVRQSTWGTSRANSPPQRITADSAFQEGPPDNRFIYSHKVPGRTGLQEGIVTLADCGLFSVFLHEAKPLKLRRVAIDNLPRFRSEPG